MEEKVPSITQVLAQYLVRICSYGTQKVAKRLCIVHNGRKMKSDLVYSLRVARFELRNFKLSFAYSHGILNVF